MKLTNLRDGRWLLEIANRALVLPDAQLDELALTVAFRLRVAEVCEVSGVGARLNAASGLADPEQYVHLCFSDEAEEFAQAVLDTAGLPEPKPRVVQP